ncbi:MAG: hypothetical protein KF795_24025 [Labilithrix sp.]|nr:hypothetical protein [Labilithrix sp.]
MSIPAKKLLAEPRQLSAATRALAGEDFVCRAAAAAAQMAPVTLAAHVAFTAGAEVIGGIDAEPNDVE